MRKILPENLIRLAENCPRPLYLVGGSVRDFLAGALRPRIDWDIASPCTEEELLAAARKSGLEARAVYKRTGTVKLTGEGEEYEFTRFRTDTYVRGLHAPSEIAFTEDISLDARRRDFCANAVYYEIKTGKFVDPLGGIGDIEKKCLRTVAPAEKVFGEDGLRLMRLARIAAQTGFDPDENCTMGAKKNASLIKDIVPERVFSELELLLHSDSFAGENAPYRGLCILRETGVLSHILPELAAGDKLEQRKDFHNYDVLEHSFRTVKYSPAEIRLAALLHDVGKPFCYFRDGNFYAHAEEGARLAEEILTRLKAPKALKAETVRLVALHMRDYHLDMRESKVRREIVQNLDILEKLFALKQADYSACKDDLSPAPSVLKWREILSRMKEEKVPFSLSELAVNGLELQRAGVPVEHTAEALSDLLDACILRVVPNEKTALVRRAVKRFGEK